jgi:hypothetical protein
MNVRRDLWLRCQEHDRIKSYSKNQAFTIVEPTKGKEAKGYSSFSIDEAIALVLATISIEDLTNFSEDETREVVLAEVREQKKAIEAQLAAKLARNNNR